MRTVILGTVVGIGVVIAAIAAAEPRGEGVVPRGAPATTGAATSGSDLIVVPTTLADRGIEVLSVFDPRQRVLCVYHVELATGRIVLKSVRNIQWDLQITDLNNEKPLPQEIRSLLEQK